MKAGKAEAHAAALQANIETVLEAIRSHGGSLKFAPKVTANDDHLSIGLGLE